MNKPLNRKLYFQPGLDIPSGWGAEKYTKGDPREVHNPYVANLVSSKLRDGRHAPVLDIDVPAKMIPSRTEGHHHLYIDVPMSWFKYKVLLRVLSWVGIIEPGYKRASIKRGFSAARLRSGWRFTTSTSQAVEQAFHEVVQSQRSPVPGLRDVRGPEGALDW